MLTLIQFSCYVHCSQPFIIVIVIIVLFLITSTSYLTRTSISFNDGYIIC